MGLMKKLTSAIVASSLVFSLAGSAFAAYTPAAGETAGNRMLGLQILKGKYPNDALALKDEITRAELVTVIVRAFGQEANAALLNGAAAYPDTASHWASGNIAMAKALVEKVGGDAIGMPDGSFAPDAKLTPAQAVAFLMKFLGVKADATKAWPASYLDVAVAQNIITAEDAALLAPMSNDNATRGLVFYLFDRAFYNYDLGAGKTFYTKYVDPSAPVVTLNAVEPTTLDSKVTITGKVEGATEAFVGTTAVTLDANGNFSVDYELPELKEYTIAVTAKDLAGNAGEDTLTVTRTTGNAATIEAAPITVAAGQTVDVAAVVKDAKGNALKDVTVTGESTVGTFADGKFTAGKVAGEGALTLTAGEATPVAVKVTVTAGALAKVEADKTAVAPGAMVTLTAKDEFGNTLTGVTYTQTSADAMLDGVNGKFMASKAGNYTVTAKAGDVTKDITIGVYATTLAKFQVSAPANLIANNASEAELVVTAADANGNTIGNYEGKFDLSAGGNLQYKDANGDWQSLAAGTEFSIKDGVKKITVRSAGVIGGNIVTVQANKIDDTASNKSTATVELVEQVATSTSLTFAESYLPNNVGGATDNNYKAVATLKVLDQAGKTMKSGAYAVKLTVAGPATISGAVSDGSKTVTFIGGSANPTVTLLAKRAESGTVTLTGVAAGLTTATATISAQPYSTATKFTVTNVTETAGVANEQDILVYKVQVTDANGVPVVEALNSNVDFNVAVDVADDYASAIYVQAANTKYDDPATSVTTWTQLSKTDKVAEFADGVFNGSGAAYVYVKAAGYTGALNLTFKDVAASGALASAASTASFKADAYAALSVKGGAQVPVAAPTSNVTIQLHDGAGNKVAAADVELVVKAYTADPINDTVRGASVATDVNINGTATTSSGVKVKTDANGTATISVTLPGYVGRDRWIEVTGTKADGTTALVASGTASTKAKLSVVNYVASNIAISLSSTDYTISKVSEEAGQTVRVKAVVKDPNGVTLGGSSYPVTLYVKEGKALDAGTGTPAIGSAGLAMTWDGTNGWYYADVIPTSAGRVVFEVEDDNAATAIAATAGIGVRAVAVKATGTGANPTAFKVIVSEAKDATSSDRKAISKNTPVPVTLTVVDAYGNTVVAPYDLKLTLAASDSGTADTLVAFRSSETGVNTTSAKIASGSTNTTVYVISGLASGASLNAFEIVVTGYYDTDGDGTSNTGAEPSLGTGTSYLKAQ